MHKLDEFESLFRSAVKDVFNYAAPDLKRVLIVSDLPGAETEALQKRVEHFLRTIDESHDLIWQAIGLADWVSVEGLLQKVQSLAPDLIVTYRHLGDPHTDVPHTLGSAVDVLTQATSTPVLLLPPPQREDFDQLLTGTHKVMVVTDHITGDDGLVNWGVHFTNKQGTLYLAHVEDDTELERYLEVIDKLRSLDSNAARKDLPEKLLSIPREYIGTIADVLAKHQIEETVVPLVVLGHALGYYKRLMTENDIDLLVLNTKDAQQQAMHAMAHALAVEIRHAPLLLL